MKNEGLNIFNIVVHFSHLTARCKGCDIIPRIGALSPTGLYVFCVDKRKCETRYNTCICKTSQQGGGTPYKSLGGVVIGKILTEDNENGADLQLYMDAHDDEIRSIISDALKELT